MRPTAGSSLKGLSLAGLGLCGIVLFCGRGAAQDTPVPDSSPPAVPQYSTANAPLRYSLKGTVVNAATGEVIRGAWVELESAQGDSDTSAAHSIALSDLRGQFEFAGSRPTSRASSTSRMPRAFVHCKPFGLVPTRRRWW
jgi:hypothetical protein